MIKPFGKALGIVLVMPLTMFAVAGEELDALTVGWEYPGASVHGGSNASGGFPGQPRKFTSSKIMTTKDPIADVIKFYEEKVSQIVPPALMKEPLPSRSRFCYSRSDDKYFLIVDEDSAPRPLRLRCYSVNGPDFQTSVVISRGEGEAETHIIWHSHGTAAP